MPSADFLTQNLRVALWHTGQASKAWPEILAGWTGGTPERARALLSGARPTDAEVQAISASGGVDPGDLYHVDMLTEIDVLRENLLGLFDSLGHGGQTQLAANLGVDPTTISKWRKGTQRPTAKHLAGVRKYFQLGEDVDLERVPLFLETEPLGAFNRRRWLGEQLEMLSVEELQELYPALRKLLAPRQ